MFALSTKLVETSLVQTVQSVKNMVMYLPSVRFRYKDEILDKREALLRGRFGYEDKLAVRGTLPRCPDAKTGMPLQEYVPTYQWCERKALFGQNDYIDILGDEKVHPLNVAYGVPDAAEEEKFVWSQNSSIQPRKLQASAVKN